MHRPIRVLLSVLAVLLLAAPSLCCAQTAAGHWEGDITLPGVKLGVKVDLVEKDKAWSGTIDIPMQALRGFKLNAVKVDGADVSFAMPGIPGDPLFVGKVDAPAASMTGNFTQAGQKFPFKLARTSDANPSASATPAKGVPGKGLEGFWQGSLKPVPVMELRIALEITKSAKGSLEGVMISLDQGGVRLPLTLTEKDGKVRLKVPSAGGTFEASRCGAPQWIGTAGS